MSDCQRWRAGRESYRPADDPIDPRLYRVDTVRAVKAVKRFVLDNHYAGTWCAARRKFVLYHRKRMAIQGVAVFSTPVNDAVLTNVFPGLPLKWLTELGRFILLDEVPGNGETWFLGECFRRLRREGFMGILAHSDPVKRTRADGTVLTNGHVGTIYQAFSGVYLGTTIPRYEKVGADGRVLSDRAISKIKAVSQGHRYAEARLAAAGELTRIRHPGKFRYAWPLKYKAKILLPESLPYPKRTA